MTTTMVPVSETSGQESGRQPNFSRVIGEECLVLLDRLGLGHSDQPPVARALGMTSCLPAEGVTTIAAQTAVAAATHLRLRTVLVDCNFARPGVHRTFGVGLCPGLRDAVEEEMPLADVLRPSGVELLSLVTAGTVQKDTSAAWLSPHVARLVEELRGEFELVLFDLPSLNQNRQMRIGTLLDGLVLVVESERVRWEIAQRATAALKSAGVELLGAVLNKRRQNLPGWLGQKMEV
jgi:Mrp family chromosome partitioning ATPase